MSSVINSIQAPQLVISSWLAENRDKKGLMTPTKTDLATVLRYRPGQTSSEKIQKMRQGVVFQDFLSNIHELLAEIKLFGIPDRVSLTESRAAISSAPDEIMAVAFDRAPIGLHHVEIQNLAYPQTNISDKLITTAAVSLDAGDYIFDLTVGEDTSSVEVRVVKTGYGADTNLDLLSKVGREIITADDRLEVFLTVTTEPDTDNVLQDWVTLTVSARQTGQAITFYLSDTSGDLVETLHLNRQVPSAWQARVFYDHRSYDSDFNELEIDKDRIVLKLFKPTKSTENIEVEKSLEAVPEQSQSLVERFNELIQFLKDHKKDIRPTILNELMSEEAGSLSSLKQIGLKALSDGRLGLTNRFYEALAAEPERVRRTLIGPDGFFTGLGAVLEGVLGRDIRHYAQPIEAVSYCHLATARSLLEEKGLFSRLSMIV